MLYNVLTSIAILSHHPVLHLNLAERNNLIGKDVARL